MPTLKTYMARIQTTTTSSAYTTISARSATEARVLLGMMYGPEKVKSVIESE